ncbi:hypothetical protein ABKV19_004802 [Rosa sericea]
MGPGSPIDFDQGWDDIEWAIVKLTLTLEGLPETPFDAEYHIYVYSTVYNMCDDHSQQVYEACRETIEAYNTEKDRVLHYLHSSSEEKLLEKVHYELLVVYAHQLLDERDSGCSALLRDNKVEDLARMYRLYSRAPKELELVVNVFRKYVTDEGKAFVQQAGRSCK